MTNVVAFHVDTFAMPVPGTNIVFVFDAETALRYASNGRSSSPGWTQRVEEPGVGSLSAQGEPTPIQSEEEA